jgi:SprT protein
MKRNNQKYMETRITNLIQMHFERAKEKFTAFEDAPFPTITWRTKGKAAGTYKKKMGQNHTLVFHIPLLCDNPKEVEQVVVHELAHYIDFYTGTRTFPHGFGWKYTMAKLGFLANVCHSMDTTNYGRRMRTYPYYCNCPDEVHHVSARIHNKIKAGAMYRCKACKGVITSAE